MVVLWNLQFEKSLIRNVEVKSIISEIVCRWIATRKLIHACAVAIRIVCLGGGNLPREFYIRLSRFDDLHVPCSVLLGIFFGPIFLPDTRFKQIICSLHTVKCIQLTDYSIIHVSESRMLTITFEFQRRLYILYLNVHIIHITVYRSEANWNMKLDKLRGRGVLIWPTMEIEFILMFMGY